MESGISNPEASNVLRMFSITSLTLSWFSPPSWGGVDTSGHRETGISGSTSAQAVGAIAGGGSVRVLAEVGERPVGLLSASTRTALCPARGGESPPQKKNQKTISFNISGSHPRMGGSLVRCHNCRDLWNRGGRGGVQRRRLTCRNLPRRAVARLVSLRATRVNYEASESS